MMVERKNEPFDKDTNVRSKKKPQTNGNMTIPETIEKLKEKAEVDPHKGKGGSMVLVDKELLRLASVFLEYYLKSHESVCSKDEPQTECEIKKEDFGTLCICSLRYCMGRKTYMPLTVQNIIREHLHALSDNDIKVMLQDRDFQARMDMYGDPCDRADWLKFWDDLENQVNESR